MVDKDLILNKIALIKGCLERIKQVTSLEPSSLDDVDKEDIFVWQLHKAVQGVIKLASHLVSYNNLGIANTYKENFDLLTKYYSLDKDLAEKLKRMVGFRNIVVHDYQFIDKNILKGILVNNLKDLEDFIEYVKELHKDQL